MVSLAISSISGKVLVLVEYCILINNNNTYCKFFILNDVVFIN